MWTLIALAAALLGLVMFADHRLRASPGRRYEWVCLTLFILSIALLAAGSAWKPQTMVGVLMALTAANTFVVYQRAKSLAAVVRVEAARDRNGGESPYEQFMNMFLTHLNADGADTIEFEFRNWRMDIRFKKGDQQFPVTNTPFHMLLQIKRIIDAATVRNLKTGEAKTRYVAQGKLYEFSAEDVGGTLLRLKLLSTRLATPADIRAFAATGEIGKDREIA